MITAVDLRKRDEQIGRLLDSLRRKGVEDNTLVVLFSDNGPASETKTGGFRFPYDDKTTRQEMDEQLDNLVGKMVGLRGRRIHHFI